MIEAVIFDMDGVIFDSEQLCLDCWTKLAGAYHLERIEEAFLKCTGTNSAETKRIMLDFYGDDFDYDAFCAKASDLFHEYESKHPSLPMKKGVVELLTYLKAKRIPLGLASSTRIASVTRQLQAAGVYDFFDVVVGGDMLQNSKPAPDIYLMACRQMHVRPENAYAVEDSYNGIRSAFAAGMKPVMVPDLLPPNEEMREKSCQILPDLTALIPMFDKELSL